MTMLEEAPKLPETMPDDPDLMHYRARRAMPSVAVCTLKPTPRLTSDIRKVTCSTCLIYTLDGNDLGLAG